MNTKKITYTWDEIIAKNVSAHEIKDKEERSRAFDEIDEMILNSIQSELHFKKDLAKTFFNNCLDMYGAKDMTVLINGVQNECNMLKYWIRFSKEDPPTYDICLTWEGIRNMAHGIYNLSTKPDFKRLPNDHIEDYENKSVEWNEKFLAKNHEDYDREAKRLSREKNAAEAALDRAIFDIVYQELHGKLSHADCRRIVKNAFNEFGHHDMDELTYQLDEWIETLDRLDCLKKRRSSQYVKMDGMEDFDGKLDLNWDLVVQDYERCRNLPSKSSRTMLPKRYCFDKKQTPKWNDEKVAEYNNAIKEENETLKKQRIEAFQRNHKMQSYMLCQQLDWLFTMDDIVTLQVYWEDKHDGEGIATLCRIFESECSELENMEFYMKLKPLPKRYSQD